MMFGLPAGPAPSRGAAAAAAEDFKKVRRFIDASIFAPGGDMVSRMPRVPVRLLFGFAAATLLSVAQTSSGTINGAVFDPSGASVPGARIRILGTETGELVRELSSGSEGTFAAPLLRPSVYTVEVTAAGFKKLVRSGIALNVDDTLSLKLPLEVGSAGEAVQVTATAELLEERSNTIGQAIEEKTIQQLPLNGRNYLQLGTLTAGAVPNSRSRDRTFSATGTAGCRMPFFWTAPAIKAICAAWTRAPATLCGLHLKPSPSSKCRQATTRPSTELRPEQ